MHWDPVHLILRAPNLCDQRILWELQKHQTILRVVYSVRWRITCHVCVANHSIYLWVHVQGLTSLGHNEYILILFWFRFVFFFGYIITFPPLPMYMIQIGQHCLPPALLCSSHCCYMLRKSMVPPLPKWIQTSLKQNSLLLELQCSWDAPICVLVDTTVDSRSDAWWCMHVLR